MKINNRNSFKLRYDNRVKYIISLIFFIIFFFFIELTHPNHLAQYLKGKKKIFTFWEPRGKIPGYLQLCMKTWKKFLPEYEIRLLDYQKSKVYLGDKLFSNIICKNMTLPIQADAIRVAILHEYGGIWMDVDNIILNGSFIKDIKNCELAMIGNNQTKMKDMAFIYATSNSSLLDKWLKELIFKVKYFKKFIHSSKKNNIHRNNSLKNIKIWNYLGNGIIDKLAINASKTEFYDIDRNALNVFPERTFFKNSSLNNIKKYKLFYFKNRDIHLIINNTKNILLLHNSWTPLKYKQKTKDEFLKENVLLSKLLKSLLNIKKKI